LEAAARLNPRHTTIPAERANVRYSLALPGTITDEATRNALEECRRRSREQAPGEFKISFRAGRGFTVL
jgi:hypothetical protein